jgi:sporulation protein YabP
MHQASVPDERYGGIFCIWEAETVAEEKTTHGIILENRQHLHLTGVTDVGAFDEQVIRTVTTMGGLVVRGKGLHISRLSLETGDMVIDGEVHALQYTEGVYRKNGFARLLR